MYRFVTPMWIVGVFALFLAAFPGINRSADEVSVPPEVLGGAEHLLSLVGPSNGQKFQPERVAGLMEFVTRKKKNGEIFSPGSANGFSSSYNEVDVRTHLVDVLKYSFNPAIPWFATTPASLRSSSWQQTETPWAQLPRLWELFGAGDAPVVIRGVETVDPPRRLAARQSTLQA